MIFVGEDFAADKGFSTCLEGEEWPLLTLLAVDEATPANDRGFSEERP